MHLQLELFIVLVSGYMECVKLHHIWKPQLHVVVYQLFITLCSAISLTYHSVDFDLSLLYHSVHFDLSLIYHSVHFDLYLNVVHNRL